eukprot:Awhi_evm1s5273
MNADGETRDYDGYNRYIKHVVDAADPINGQWGAWSPLTVVSGTTCSDIISEKTRVCDNPPPSNGGVACVGESKETIVSDCIEDVYSLTESTRADNQDNLIELYKDKTVEECQARCSELEACLNFDYNLQYNYCYLHSVSAETKKYVGYSRYVKFTVDTSKDIDGSWGSWSEWEEGPGEHCSNKFKQRSRMCDSPPRYNNGLDCVGDATVTEKSQCFYGLPDLASYPDTFVEHAEIKSTSLGTYVQMLLKDVDLNTCKRYALIRQSDPVRAVDYNHKEKKCYIQGKEFFMAGNTTSDADFTHLEVKNVPSPNLVPMPGPYVDVQKKYAKHTSSSSQILNVTTDEDNCRAQCLEISDCLFVGYISSTSLCIIYDGNITDSIVADPDGLENIYLLDRIWTGFPKSIPSWPSRDLKISAVSIVDKTLAECKLLCLYNHECQSISYNHINQADSCTLYSSLLDPTFELFALYNDEEGYEINFSYHKINDLTAFGLDTNYKSNEGGRSVPFFSNVIHEITGYVTDCQRTCLGLNDCVAFDFTTYTDITDHGRCYLQNATTEESMLSTADSTFYYYELATNSLRVDQDEKSEALHCPEGVSCIGVFEKFEGSRSQFMWENIIFELEDGRSVDECKQACVDLEDCVALDYDFVDKQCYLKGYSHAVVKSSDYLHFKLTAREVPTPDNDQGGLSKTMLIIIIACSAGGFVLFIVACLIGLKIYKKKQQDLLDGMTPKEYVLQNGGNGEIDLITDEEYQKSKEFIGDSSLDTSLDTLVVNEKEDHIKQEAAYVAIAMPEAGESKTKSVASADYLVIDQSENCTPSQEDDSASSKSQPQEERRESDYIAVIASQLESQEKEAKEEAEDNEYVDMNGGCTSSETYVDLPTASAEYTNY